MNETYKVIEQHHKENFATLVKRYKRPLGSVQAAEDVVQEAYARALKYANRWDPSQPFAPWFSIILRNAFRDQLNMERGITFEPIDEFNYESIIDTSRIDELKDAIRASVAKEPEDNQVALKLFFLAGMSGKEVSQVTPFSHSNVRQIVFKFKNKFLKDYKYT